ncbi:class I mannose-6-phosphate isomerase [Candidatus Poribacteria bacterium]|nr:class I mannose-6-phosphate isomerase [Candidatus Poribacteria bacterium]
MSATPGSLYPLVLDPIFKYRIWGGRRLEQFLGKKLPPGEPIGESWEVSCRNNDNSIIRNGELAGSTLAHVFTSSKEALLGASFEKTMPGFQKSRPDFAGAHNAAPLQKAIPEGPVKFPLLNKFVDANELLSVQVHPDENSATRFAGAEAKTEAWYIIHADPGATLIKGLKPGVTAETFEEAIADNSVPRLLNTFSVSSGDMIFVPAGCVHAMGKGLLVCEIQQNSDTTFRVYDWGRVGADGKPRQLHIKQALQAMDFSKRSPNKVTPVEIAEGRNERAYLVACRHFAMERLKLEEPAHETTGGRKFDSLMVLSGRALIRPEQGDETEISTGDSSLIPACVGDYTIVPINRCTLLKVYVPDIEMDVMGRLRSNGILESAIRGIVF